MSPRDGKINNNQISAEREHIKIKGDMVDFEGTILFIISNPQNPTTLGQSDPGGRPGAPARCCYIYTTTSSVAIPHELGHVVGLGHTDNDQKNLMFSRDVGGKQLRKRQWDVLHE
jgi:hypothetical protein